MVNKRHLLCYALIVIYAIATLTGCADRSGETEIGTAKQRIQTAIDNIEVRASGASAVLGDFRPGDGKKHYEIVVNMDFQKLLTGVHKDDFVTARSEADELIRGLYSDLSIFFSLTDKLTLQAKNVDSFDDYDMPEDMRNMRDLEIQIGRFMSENGKLLQLDTDFGYLDVTSDFFHGNVLGSPDGYQLYFGLEQADEMSDSILTVLLKDSRGRIQDCQNLGSSYLLTIPLSLDLMRDERGNLRYDAVEYIDYEGTAHGVLARSYIDDENMYIYANRMGKFRLTQTEHRINYNEALSDPARRALFLSDRGIPLATAASAGELVSRGQFFDALMRIHWAERLDHQIDLMQQSFPDVERGTDLNMHLLIGKNMSGFRLVGYESGLFNPNREVWRRELFDMLWSYINYYNMEDEIVGLMPARSDVVDASVVTEDQWWKDSYVNLVSTGFIQYRYYNGSPYVAHDDYVTIKDTNELLFKLICGIAQNKAHLLGRVSR